MSSRKLALLKPLAPLFALAAIGILVGGYILSQQTSFRAPSWLPWVGEGVYVVNAQFSAAQAVVPSQGQPVNVAGIRVGLVGDVTLKDGRAVIRMDLDEPRKTTVHRDARITLRPRTPLKDMYLALDPGTPAAGAIPEGGTLPVAQTQPDVSGDELLNSLDRDTRASLQLLLQAAGTGFGANADGQPDPNQVKALRSAFKQFAPLAKDTRTVNEAVLDRREALSSAVHSLSQIGTELGSVDQLLAGWVTHSDQALTVFADQADDLRAALDAFPGALRETSAALAASEDLSTQTQRATRGLSGFATGLAPALQSLRTLARETLPTVRDDIRPSAREIGPSVARLRAGSTALPTTLPALQDTAGVLRRFLQALSAEPGGKGDSYLFWSAWLAHNASSATGLQDAHGPIGRTLPLFTCPQLEALAQIEGSNPTLGALIQLSNLPDRFAVCPNQTPLFGSPTGTSGASGASGATGSAIPDPAGPPVETAPSETAPPEGPTGQTSATTREATS